VLEGELILLRLSTFHPLLSLAPCAGFFDRGQISPPGFETWLTCRCAQGVCQGSTVGGQIQSWIETNKPLVIGISCGVGGLLLLSVICCCISCFRRRRRQVRNVPKLAAAGHTGGWSGSNVSSAGYPANGVPAYPQGQWGGGPAVQPQYEMNRFPGGGGRGPGAGMPAPVPPMYGAPAGYGSHTVRYA